MTAVPDPPDPGGFPPPRRRLQLELSVQADDLNELDSALTEIRHAVAYEGLEDWSTSRRGIWSGYRLRLTCDDSMTAERYRELALRHRQAVQEDAV